jgi:ADP-heptose:LPS heptosyltransferase
VTPLDGVNSIAILRARTGLGDLLCGVPFPGWPGIPERPVDIAAIPGFLERAAGFDLALQAYGANPAANEATAALRAERTGGFFVPGAIEAPDLDLHLPYPQHRHEVDRHLDLMAHLGAPAQGRELEFPLTPADEVVELEAPYALLHPGATSSSRRWPLERFAVVGDELARRGYRVAVTGVRGEEELTATVCAAMHAPARDLCGATSLGSFAALVRDAALLVSNDTGAAHLAAAVGTPSVTIFLAGDPQRWAHPAPHAVARVQVECNPCPHLVCPIDHRCAQRLGAEQVLGAVDAVA